MAEGDKKIRWQVVVPPDVAAAFDKTIPPGWNRSQTLVDLMKLHIRYSEKSSPPPRPPKKG